MEIVKTLRQIYQVLKPIYRVFSAIGEIGSFLWLLVLLGVIETPVHWADFLIAYRTYFVLLALAAFWIFSLWIGYQIRAWGKPKQEQLQGALSPTELNGIEAYDYSELVAKYPWVRLLPQAKQEIVVLGAACESISHHADFLKQLLEANKDLTISCVLVNADVVLFRTELEKEKGWIALRKTAEASLERLKAAKDQMTEDERNRFTIEAYEAVPPFNMVVLDPQTENAYMQVGYYPTGIDQNYRITNVFHKKDKRAVFLKYWNEYLSYSQTYSSVGY
jgi:hypothetical protein